MSNFYIGLTSGSMSDVTTLSADAVAPVADFRRWTDVAALGSGLARGCGTPIATWYWCFIPPLMRYALRNAYCSGKSARVYIRTEKDVIGTTAVFEAAMWWPDNENARNPDDFVIEFRDLIEQVST